MRYNANVNQKQSDLPGGELGKRPGFFDSQFEMITLDEAIDFVIDLNKKHKDINFIGLNIELKLAEQY